jgi:glutamine cyclotransferase
MNKILGLFSFAILCSCGDKANSDTTPSLNIVNQEAGLSVTIENSKNTDAVLLVNGCKIEKLNASGETTIGIEHLEPGMNYLSLVSGKDTLSDSTFFSYKVDYQLVREYAHDTANFTEGLFLEDNVLYESTGLEGKSKILRYRFGPQGLTLLNEISIDETLFGEGIAAVNNSLYMLTWQNHYVLELDKSSLKRKGQFVYPNEGWGLTPNGDSLIASDGTATLSFINPAKFEIYKRLEVKGENGPVKNINELELVGNIIVANVWQTNSIIFISKKNGIVIATADLTALANSASQENSRRDVLNGIAYDPSDDTFIITGKNWTKLYRIKLDAVWNKLKGM